MSPVFHIGRSHIVAFAVAALLTVAIVATPVGRTVTASLIALLREAVDSGR